LPAQAEFRVSRNMWSDNQGNCGQSGAPFHTPYYCGWNGGNWGNPKS
jgi:hypothetical protein